MGFLLVFFISLSVLGGDIKHILIDSSVFLVLFALYYLFRKEKYKKLVSHSFVIILCASSYFYVLTGGVEDTGLIFIVLLPIPVILLMGRKLGTLVLSVLFLVSIASLLVFKNTEWIAHYMFNFSLRVFVCFIFLSFLTYLNEAVFDIIYSRLKKTTDSLQESREQYKSLSLSREKVFSIIFHDIKDQVASFNSATEILKTKYNELREDERKDIIEMLSESSKRNMRLLKDLLKWSMIKNHSFPFNPVPIKLEKIYREVIELFDMEIDKKNISIFLKMKSNSEVFADYDMLSAVMRNLISNAIKFSKKNGEILIMSEEQNEFMIVKVKDNGKGMDEKTLHDIQHSISTSSIGTENEHGTGIGLLLVKEFIECNKGTMLIESTMNKGTTISFTIPLVE